MFNYDIQSLVETRVLITWYAFVVLLILVVIYIRRYHK